MNEVNGNKASPWWLGVGILARHDPNLGYTRGNILWRTALSAEEAETQLELYVGAALRERLLEIEREGWIKVDRTALAKIKDLPNGQPHNTQRTNTRLQNE